MQIIRSLLLAVLTLPFVISWQGRVISVAAGGDLQAAIDSALPGDTISLAAGASFVGPFTLKNKSGSGTIVIQTAAINSLAAGRTSPAQSALMPKILAPNADRALRTEAGAHDYTLVGIEVAPLNSTITVYSLIDLGGNEDQTTMAQVPQRIVFDRMYIHGLPNADSQRGVALNSGETTIKDCYISDIHGRGYDTQAIGGWNGPGPFKIINNYLEAAGENFMLGGALARIPNLIPTGVEFRHNHVHKPLSWYVNDPSYGGFHWTIKNLFELKNARNVIVEGNVFDGNWTDAQAGVAVQFTPRPSDSGPAAVVEDVQFINNIVRNTGSGINILGMDNEPMPQVTTLRRVRVANNVWENIDGPRFGSSGTFATVIKATEDVTIEHNTVINSTGNVVTSDYLPSARFIFRNNIVRHNLYGIFGSGYSPGNSGINYYFPGSVITKNVMTKEVDGPDNLPAIYPAGNYFPATMNDVGFVDLANRNYRLASGSIYKNAGTDGKDIGADIDVLTAALGGTPTPLPTPSVPTPTPTPTASPTPTPAPSPSPVAPSCSVTVVSSITVPQWGSRVVSVTLNDLSAPATITTLANPGQIKVNPIQQTVSGTAAVAAFNIVVKNKSGTVTFTTPCGNRTVNVLLGG